MILESKRAKSGEQQPASVNTTRLPKENIFGKHLGNVAFNKYLQKERQSSNVLCPQ
jgi:hypothetical protein